MTAVYEGANAIYLACRAQILDTSKEMAWAERHVVENADHKWILGRYAEADRANANRQHFAMDNLKFGQPLLTNSPLNVNHGSLIVGTFVASEIVYPAGAAPMSDDEVSALWVEMGRSFSQEEREKLAKSGAAMSDGSFPIVTVEDLKNAIMASGRAKNHAAAVAHIKKRAKALGHPELIPAEWSSLPADEEDLNPYLEALSVFWKHYFEDEFQAIEAAHKSGKLFYSMECVPTEIGCYGDRGCGTYFEYAGRNSPTYCAHLNDPQSGVWKDLVQPRFTAGALIVPPVQPGWARADIKQISQIVKDHADKAEALYSGLQEDAPEADSKVWEEVMAQIMLEAEANGELAEFQKKAKKKKAPKGYQYGPNGELRHADN